MNKKDAIKAAFAAISKMSQEELLAELDKPDSSGWGELIAYAKNPDLYEKSLPPPADVSKLAASVLKFARGMPFMPNTVESWEACEAALREAAHALEAQEKKLAVAREALERIERHDVTEREKGGTERSWQEVRLMARKALEDLK